MGIFCHFTYYLVYVICKQFGRFLSFCVPLVFKFIGGTFTFSTF